MAATTVPPDPNLRKPPAAWVGFILMFLFFGIVIAISLMSKNVDIRINQQMSLLKNTARNGVIALNVILIIILSVLVFVPTSDAQISVSSQYMAVPSQANGITTGAVYIMNTTSQELVAVAWNRNKKKIMPLGYRNLSSDAQSVGGSKQ